jgi:hypothetical protein
VLIQGGSVFTTMQANLALTLLSTLVERVTPSNSFAPMLSIFVAHRLHLQHSQLNRIHALRSVSGEGDIAAVSATVAALEGAYTNADLFGAIGQIRGDELDGAGTHELVHPW